MLHGRTLGLLLGAVVCSALGQLLLKSGAGRLSGLGGRDFLLAAARQPQVASGIAALAASTLCWLYVLRVAPLSRAYLVSSLTYVLVPLASVFLFGEQLRRLHVAGTVLIVLGVACLLAGE